MEKVTKYVTKDGEIFDTKTAAQRHEKLLKLIDRYDDAVLSDGEYLGEMSFEDVVDWMQYNLELAKDMLTYAEIKMGGNNE